MYSNIQKSILKSFLVILFFSPLVVSAATLSINPATGSFDTGERVTVKVVVTSNNVPLNAVSGMVVFPPSLFTIESVSKTNSVLNFWVTDPAISKNSGTVKFEGVALGGFTGSTGTVLTVNLRAKEVGTGTVSFESGQILANDGEGTDITGNLSGATYYVQAGSPTKAPAVKATKEEMTLLPEAQPVAEVTQPAPTLEAPEIMLGEKYGAPSIVGTSSYPKAQVLTTFVAEDGSKVFILGTAEADGSFNILIPKSLKHGPYTVSAVMIQKDKTNSQTSNAIVVMVGSPLSDVGWQVWLAISLLILTILYLLLRVNSHLNNGSGVSKHKLSEAQKVAEKSFDLLREDIAEHSTMSELKKDINEAEKIIEKKIKDIEQ